jgi:hypothetical protein
MEKASRKRRSDEAAVEKMPNLRSILPAFLWGVIIFLSAVSGALSKGDGIARKESYLEILSSIYKEVKELGPYPGQDFIAWDFFIGEDDDDTNKNIHANILIQSRDEGERMALLVSRLEPSRNDPKVLLTKESREISCRVKNGRAEIVSSAYTTEELERLLPGLLRAIKDKKKLLNR